MIKVKRTYYTVEVEDGTDFVDRLWPRGIGKDELKMDTWLKNVAPARNCESGFGHDPSKWSEFRPRHFLNSRQIRTASGYCRSRREKRGDLALSSERPNTQQRAALCEFLKAHLVSEK